VQVNLKLPAPRVGLPDGSALTASSSALSVVAGETFTDASDGVIAGHFATWTLDGTPVKALPTTPMSAGGVGPHTMTFTGSYGQYDADTFATTKPMYTTAPISMTYEARPFVFSFNPATKTGNTVRFTATARKTSDTATMSATSATATWTLKSGGVDVVPPLVTPVTSFGTPFAFDVVQAIPNNSVLSLTLSVDEASLSAAAKPYKSYTQTMTLEAPAPSITVSGCANANASCTFTAGGSITGATLKWTLTLNGNQVGSIGTEPTFSPNLTAAGTYVISLAATKTVFTTTVNQNVTVAQSLCSPPPGVDFVTIWASCTTNCATNTDITFRADFYGYVPQTCDEWVWNFGDNQSSTLTGVDGMFATHKYATNNSYTVRLTIKNGAGQTIVTPTVVVVGSGTPPPPPPPTCNAPNTVTFTYSGSKGCRAGIDCKVGEIITFSPRKNNASLQSCDSASWRFGDNGSSVSKSPNKSYDSVGSYPVNLTIFNEKGTGEATTQTIKVVEDVASGCSRAPTDVDFYLYYLGQTSGCSYSNDKLCTPGEVIEFKAFPFFGYTFQSCDKFEWKFGDGTTSPAKEVEHIYPPNDNTFVATLRLYNSLGGAELTSTLRFNGAPAVPPPVLTAAFPKTGSKGATVTFVADSNLDTTTGWTWDFGDGTAKNTSQATTTSNRSTITHTFATAGTYTVTASARNSLSASTALTAVATDRIVISDVPTYRFLLPAVIHAPGLNGSSWRSDVQVYYGAPNPVTEPLHMSADFNGQVSQLEINKSTFIYEDFVLTLTGKDGQGSVLLTTQSKYKPQIWTRTYSVDASGKTFGQFIPAVEITGASGASVDASADPVKYYLAGLREDTRYRTNLGFINPNSTDVTANVVVYDDLRIPLTQFAVAMAPYQLVSINGLKTKVPGLPNRPVTLEITVPAGNWLVAYASFIDGFSNDPAYIPAIAETSLAGTGYDKGITPGVGHVGDWRSDVTIFNPDSAGVRVDLTYYDALGLPRAEAKDVFIGAGQVKTYNDLLKAPGLWSSNPPDGLGMLLLKTTTPVTHYPLTFSRTYNDKGSGGTFGQGIPGFAAVNANVKPGSPGIIPAVRNDANYKTNIGLTNTTGNVVSVKVYLLDPNTGAVARELAVDLNAYQSVVGTYDFGSLSTGTFKVEITNGAGAVWAFASIINQGNDPEYVPAIPVQ
jgi:PKD repeat protein